ncbi:MAG: type II secretion system protein N, partial [Pseudomonadota bacterium]|nr:type II secretion system protein N [Pseudomonadota bacterium]
VDASRGRDARQRSSVPGGIVVAAGLLLGACLEFVVETPPGVLRWLAFSASAGQLELAGAQGGLWSGAADLRWHAAAAPVLALGRWDWHFSVHGLLRPAWQVKVTQGPVRGSFIAVPGMAGVGLDQLDLQARADTLPAGLGMLDLVHPSGQLALQAPHLELQHGRWSGAGTGSWRNAASSLVALAPLGSWRAEWRLQDGSGDYRISTESGPLHLDGSGQLRSDRAPSLQARAWSDPADAAVLQPMLQMFGPAAPDGSVLIRQP